MSWGATCWLGELKPHAEGEGRVPLHARQAGGAAAHAPPTPAPAGPAPPCPCTSHSLLGPGVAAECPREGEDEDALPSLVIPGVSVDSMSVRGRRGHWTRRELPPKRQFVAGSCQREGHTRPHRATQGSARAGQEAEGLEEEVVRPFPAAVSVEGMDGRTVRGLGVASVSESVQLAPGRRAARPSGARLGDQGGSHPEVEEVGQALLACLRWHHSLRGEPRAASRLCGSLGAWAPQRQPGRACQSLRDTENRQGWFM